MKDTGRKEHTKHRGFVGKGAEEEGRDEAPKGEGGSQGQQPRMPLLLYLLVGNDKLPSTCLWQDRVDHTPPAPLSFRFQQRQDEAELRPTWGSGGHPGGGPVEGS